MPAPSPPSGTSEPRRTSPRKRRASPRPVQARKKAPTKGAKASTARRQVAASGEQSAATGQPPAGSTPEATTPLAATTTPAGTMTPAATPTPAATTTPAATNPGSFPQTHYEPSRIASQFGYGGAYAQQTPYGQALYQTNPHPSSLLVQNNYANMQAMGPPPTPYSTPAFFPGNNNTQLYMGQYPMPVTQAPNMYGLSPAPPPRHEPVLPPAATTPAPAFGVDFSLLLQEPTAPTNDLQPSQSSQSTDSGHVNASNIDLESGHVDASNINPSLQPDSADSSGPSQLGQDADKDANDSDDEYEEDPQGNIVKTAAFKGRHVSTINNFYGNVDGVGRGIEDWVVARTMKMGPAFTDQRDATRAHNAMLRTVISRAEHLSTRTGSWLYIAAQHPGSNNGFIHYASVKLRKNAEELGKLHAQAGRTMAALMDGSRKEVTKLSAEVMEKDVQIKSLEEKLLAAEASLSVKDTDLARLGQVLALVKAGDPRTLALLAEATAELSNT